MENGGSAEVQVIRRAQSSTFPALLQSTPDVSLQLRDLTMDIEWLTLMSFHN